MNVCTTNDTALLCQLRVNIGIFPILFVGLSILFFLPIQCYTIWVIIRRHQQKMASDFILLNQIFVELILSLSGMSYYLSIYLLIPLNPKPFQFFSFMFLIMRPMLQSYVCTEQHLAAVHPVIFLRYKAMWYKVATCCACWLTVITVSLVGVSVNSTTEFFYVIAALYALFLLWLTYCCVSVLRVLRRRAPGEGQGEQHCIKKKAFKIILINLVVICLAQLPMVIVLSLMEQVPFALYLTIYSVNISGFVISGLVPSLLFLYRVGKLCRQCNCL